MTPDQWKQGVELWNAGKSLGEIGQALGLGIYDLHPMTRAATREVRRMQAAGEDMTKPVRLDARPLAPGDRDAGAGRLPLPGVRVLS